MANTSSSSSSSSPPRSASPLAASDDVTEDVTAVPAMECSIYQNFSASEVFIQGLAGIVNQQDVEAMIRAQKKMLQRFEKTNEMLSNCNTLSSTRLERATRDFRAHTTKIVQMRKDLDNVLKRIAALKHHVAQQHPEAFASAGGSSGPVGEEDDEYDVQLKEKRRKEREREAKAH